MRRAVIDRRSFGRHRRRRFFQTIYKRAGKTRRNRHVYSDTHTSRKTHKCVRM